MGLFRRYRTGIGLLCLLVVLVAAKGPNKRVHKPLAGSVVIEAEVPLRAFRPATALGACIDGMEKGDMVGIFTPANVAAMKTAGLQPLAYRLRTELGVECWHWNPQGYWSEARHRRGYWVSEATPTTPITLSNGYRLPRRGDTIDQANDEGYSRLDDGDLRTFWKSDPYLDRYYTHESNALHPQWILVDLGKPRPVNAIRIFWAEPYATRFGVEYWQTADGETDHSIDDTYNTNGWHLFPRGMVEHGTGADALRTLCKKPISVRLVRIWMTESSERAPKGATDVRDGLGYAVREVQIGWLDKYGRLHDEVHHVPNKHQTLIYVSSTDPWHRAQDRDSNVEQPGFDLVKNSGLSGDLPMLVPVGLLYDTPENAVAELHWLEARGVSIKCVELGEEPDGQYVSPEDYGALFVEWATAIHRFDPHLLLVGPGFQTELQDVLYWPNVSGDRSWVHRFLVYLKQHGHFDDLRYFSFEWYPFDNACTNDTEHQLLRNPLLLQRTLARWRAEGVPKTVPWIVSEYGYSAFAGRPEADRPAALLNAEIVGMFLSSGGDTAYLYGYAPQPLMDELQCNSWGNLALFLSDNRHRIKQPLATYYAAWMLTHIWASPPHAKILLYSAHCSVEDSTKQVLVAFATKHPDGRWAIMLLNKDTKRAIAVKLVWHTKRGAVAAKKPIEVWQLSSSNYVWHAHGADSYAAPDKPPLHFTVNVPSRLTLPPTSLTVIGCTPAATEETACH